VKPHFEQKPPGRPPLRFATSTTRQHSDHQQPFDAAVPTSISASWLLCTFLRLAAPCLAALRVRTIGIRLGAQAPLTPPSPCFSASQQYKLCANARGRGARCAQSSARRSPSPIFAADDNISSLRSKNRWLERSAITQRRTAAPPRNRH
jgi:hypothetical protein